LTQHRTATHDQSGIWGELCLRRHTLGRGGASGSACWSATGTSARSAGRAAIGSLTASTTSSQSAGVEPGGTRQTCEPRVAGATRGGRTRRRGVGCRHGAGERCMHDALAMHKRRMAMHSACITGLHNYARGAWVNPPAMGTSWRKPVDNLWVFCG
jgi:hypothetical protein